MFFLWEVERWFRGWVRRRWAAAVAASVPFALLAWPCAGPWLRVLGAAAAAHVLYCVCAQFRVSSIWPSGRVDAKKRAVVVTGCDSGFGHATALRLHAAGVGRVFACVLDGGSAGAEALRALSPRVCVIPCDVTDAAAVAAAVGIVRKEVHASGCELWAIVNNAGILCVGECEWMEVEDVQKAINVNTLGQIRVTQAFLPLLREIKGRVVNVNSLASRCVVATLTPYVISKYSSLAFTDSLRQEMSKFSVTVHSIEPWIVKTPMTKGIIAVLSNTLNEIPAGIKSVYNEQYRDALMTLCKWIFYLAALPESKIMDVVDSIEDACLSTYPEDRYIPGIFPKLFDCIIPPFHFGQQIFLKLFFRQ